MKSKKVVALIATTVLVLSLVACGNENENENVTTNESETTEEVVVEMEDVGVSVDFEDGLMEFVTCYGAKANADEAVLSVEDFNGSKALKVTNGSGKVPYVAIDISSLTGDAVANIASIEFTIATEMAGDTFYAASGKLYTWVGEELGEFSHPWSVYLEEKNPKTAVAELDSASGEAFVAGNNNIIMVTLETDNALDAGEANSNFYIDDIRFLDAEGGLIVADTSVVFAAPAGFDGEVDMSNLKYLVANPYEVEGMEVSGDGWAQAGIDITDDMKAALVPGSVIEINYASEMGDMWLVFNEAPNGWIRVQQQTAATNLSMNTCQITYEEIMEATGAADASELAGQIQCEASGAWEVYGMKIAMDSGLVALNNKTDIPDSELAADGWAQAGIEITDDLKALLVPGSVVEINYASEANDMWLVFNEAPNGWIRVQQQTAATDGKIAQITYEQIMEATGAADASELAGQLQCEASTAWEVYGISIGTPSGLVSVKGLMQIPGTELAGDGWAQVGIDLTDEIKAMLVPGSAIEISYASEANDMWLVFNEAPNGWVRVQQQTAATDGKIAQITYEQIMEATGATDASELAGQLQFEASTAWEVFGAYIGTYVE